MQEEGEEIERDDEKTKTGKRLRRSTWVFDDFATHHSSASALDMDRF